MMWLNPQEPKRRESRAIPVMWGCSRVGGDFHDQALESASCHNSRDNTEPRPLASGKFPLAVVEI